MSSSNGRTRCPFPGNDPLMIRYHDEEWGIPLHEDLKLFEFLVLESFQAGLSWRTVLYKRENFRKALDGFDPVKIAAYGNQDCQRLMGDIGLIRNRAKIEAAINNAQRFLDIQRAFGSFDHYIWQFTNHQAQRGNTLITMEDMPATSPESDAMAADLKRWGLKFAGSTICYAYMQATGMVNDHISGCFRAGEL